MCPTNRRDLSHPLPFVVGGGGIADYVVEIRRFVFNSGIGSHKPCFSLNRGSGLRFWTLPPPSPRPRSVLWGQLIGTCMHFYSIWLYGFWSYQKIEITLPLYIVTVILQLVLLLYMYKYNLRNIIARWNLIFHYEVCFFQKTFEGEPVFYLQLKTRMHQDFFLLFSIIS